MLSVAFEPVMLSVVMLSVIFLCVVVVTPNKPLDKFVKKKTFVNLRKCTAKTAKTSMILNLHSFSLKPQ